MKSKTITVSEFKVKSLKIIHNIQEENLSSGIANLQLLITQVSPQMTSKEGDNRLKGSILFQDDLISSIDVEWEANRTLGNL